MAVGRGVDVAADAAGGSAGVGVDADVSTVGMTAGGGGVDVDITAVVWTAGGSGDGVDVDVTAFAGQLSQGVVVGTGSGVEVDVTVVVK